VRPTVSPAKNSLVYFISIAYIHHPVLRGHCQEAKIGEADGHRITRNCAALGSFLLTCAITELSLIAVCCLIGATPRGQPWTPAVTLPQGRDGLSAQRMAVLWTFREPSLGRYVHRELLRNTVLDLTPIIPATACHQRNYVERYSRSMSRHTSTMTISLPKHLKEFVKERSLTAHYGTPSDYIRGLIREDLKRLEEEWLEVELMKGLKSGKGIPMTKDAWKQLKTDALKGLDHGIGHIMLVEVDSEEQEVAPPIPKAPQTSNAASDRKIAPPPLSRRAG
jgi:antitoxin ParD1/3/4